MVGRSPRGLEVLRPQGSRRGAPRHSLELGSLRTPCTSPFPPPGDSPPFSLLGALPPPPHTLLPLSETPLPKDCRVNAKFQLTTSLPWGSPPATPSSQSGADRVPPLLLSLPFPGSHVVSLGLVRGYTWCQQVPPGCGWGTHHSPPHLGSREKVPWACHIPIGWQ